MPNEMKEKALQVKQDFDDVYEAGKQDAVTTWWNTYLQNGKRRNFNQAFAGYGWYPEIFKPNHDLIVNDGYAMFTTNGNTTDLVKTFADLGITLDTSSSVAMGNFFYNNTNLTHAPALSFKNINPKQDSTSIYSGCVSLQYIEGIYLKADGSVKFTNWFRNCNKLTTIREIRGIIGQDINLQWSKKLTLESLISLFNCLKSFPSDDAEYMTKTITLSEESWALTKSIEFYNYFDGNNGHMLCQVLGWLEG